MLLRSFGLQSRLAWCYGSNAPRSVSGRTMAKNCPDGTTCYALQGAAITMLFLAKVQGLLSQLAACRCDDAVDLTRQGFVDGLGLVRVQYASYLGHSAVTH